MTEAPLAQRLEDLLGQDGFDLTARLGTAAAGVAGISLPSRGLDLGAVSSGLDGLADLDTSGLVAAVGHVVGGAAGTLARLPAVGDLLGPLDAVTAPVRLLADPGTRGLADRLAGLGAGGPPGTGLSAVSAGVGRLTAGLAEPDVAGTLAAIGALVPGLGVSSVLDLLRGPAPGVAALVRLVGALMAVESAVREVVSLGEGLAGLLDDGRADGVRLRVAALGSGQGIAAALASADPQDVAEAARLAGLVRELRVTVEVTADLLRTGLGFGEAALVAVDVPGLATRLETATAGVAEGEVAAVADLSAAVAGWLAPLLAFDVPRLAPDLDALWDRVEGVVGSLAGAVDGLDLTALLAPVTAQLRGGLDALGQLESRAREVVAVVRAAMDTVVEAARALDVTPLTDAVHLVLDPVAAAIHAVEDAVTSAEDAVRDVATRVTAGLGHAEDEIGGAAADVLAAFERVRAAVEALDLAHLGDHIRDGLAPVVAALQSADLSPYFDAAVDVMTSTADVLAAVPLDLLPDDVEADLREAVAPVKAIDFDAAVVTPLRAQLGEIRDGVDVSVLDAVRDVQQAAVAFLQAVAPEPALQEFEAEVFDPFIAAVQALDPAAVLAPVHDLLAEAAASLARIDVRRLVEPVDDVFDDVLGALDGLDPAQLVGDALAEVTDTVTAAREVLDLDAWRGRLDAADAALPRLAARVDLAPLTAVLGAVWDDLVAEVRSPVPHRPSGIGVLVAGLLQSTPTVVRPEAFETVRRWIGGAVDAAADVSDRVTGAADAFAGALDAAERLDPAPLVASLTAAHDAVTAAAAALPDGPVRRAVTDELLGADPRDLVGPLLAGRERYLVLLRAAAASVAGLESAGRSELAAVSRGLQDAVRPLAVVPQRLRALLAGLGVEVGTDLRAALADLLAGSPPERALAPLAAVLAGLRDKLVGAVRDAMIGPVREALDDVDGVLDALDLSFVGTELAAAYDAARPVVEALRPSTLLAPVLDELDALVALVAGLDPLAAVEPVLREMRDAVARVADELRPTVLARPALDAYDEVVAAVAAVDVDRVLAPLLAALDTIEAQLEDGLTRAGGALGDLQEALP